MRSDSARQKARKFLQTAHLYHLGALPSEQPHPRTRHLSRWAQSDLDRGVAALQAVDLAALDRLIRQSNRLQQLARAVEATLCRGRRIYLCGCGATGRLAMSLEFLWRQRYPGSDQVRAFMAGGDVALVHALEGFEDHPEYGARHLEEMDFADGDLLIACTEGGETPYVIGATRRAAALSANAPFFLYCNDDDSLARHVQRFRDLQADPRIRRLSLEIGPMALSGSTRMQASTVLQLAVGTALMEAGTRVRSALTRFRDRVAALDFGFLAEFVAAEAAIYQRGDHITYRVRHYGITVLTDTTERSPTFSLVPFDQLTGEQAEHSLCYVALDEARNPSAAWKNLLQRTPRALNWQHVDPRTGAGHLMGFDFSHHAHQRRRRQIPRRRHHSFFISRVGSALELRLQDLQQRIPVEDGNSLHEHLLLKLLLNIHSTLVMGRLGRYRNNMMTWVTPTNGKLVDRAARYVHHLLLDNGHPSPGYERIVHCLFEEMEQAAPGESVVMRTVEALQPCSRTG